MNKMRPSEITAEWVKAVSFKAPTLNAPAIDGVSFRPLKVNLDGRGDVIEMWSEPWGYTAPAHVYQSATDYGVVKCWHLHEIHTDQFAITRGKIQVTVVDVREESSTFGSVDTFIVGSQLPGFIRIPPGLMHGWKALSQPEVIVYNFQSHVYDSGDEFKFAWDCVLPEVWQPKNG
jgi:dTDP-4-dehydrorhamnose 3,5-epimerase